MKYFALENLVGRADTNTSVGRCSNVKIRAIQPTSFASFRSKQRTGDELKNMSHNPSAFFELPHIRKLWL